MLKIVLKKLAGALVLKLKKKLDLPIKPNYLHFNITYRCNARCSMCNIWRKYKKDRSQATEEMTFAEIEAFFRTNRDFLSDLKGIGLTGGEPFLRKDLVEIVRMIHSLLPETVIGIQTNGFLPVATRNKLREIRTFFPEIHLAVSLDGTENTHDRVRGIKGGYKKVLETLSFARDLGLERITMGMTLTPLNYQEIPAVCEIAKEYRCEFSCFPAEAGTRYSNIGEAYGFSRREKKKLIEELEKFDYHYYMDNLRRFWTGRKRARSLPCYSGYTSLDLDPYGNIRPCVLLPDVFGNVKEEPLQKMLYSEKAKGIKKRMKRCSCWSQCEVSTSAVVDPFDVLRWFLSCSNKKKFLKQLKEKRRRLE
jgi:MoaA/NifB/PqqE/SkfB family radical SAM enzyme